jgi:hypothetical protein
MDSIILFQTDVIFNDRDIELGSEWSFYNPLELILQKLDEFEQLKDDWDGYGASSMDSEVLSNTRNFIKCMNDFVIDNVSDLYPNAHGTISIEWLNSEGQKLCLEIGRSNYSYFIDYLNNEPKLINGEDIFSNTQSLASEIEKLVGQKKTAFFLN